MNSVQSASRLYELATAWNADRLLVEHAGAEGFSASVGALVAALGEDAADDYWAGLMRSLKALRWRLATMPLPFDHPAIGVSFVADSAVPQLRRCQQIAPNHAAAAERIADQLEQLRVCADDPLGDAIRLTAAAASAVVLLVDGSSVEPVGTALGEGFASMSSPQLLRSRTDQVIAVGPSTWFPRSVLQAPRSPFFTFAYFGWLRDREPDLDLLVGSGTQLRQALAAAPARPARALEREPTDDPEGWRPVIEWRAVSRAASRDARGEHHGELVAAQLFLLASGDGVYLQSRQGAKAFTAELEDEITVHQLPVADIEEGTFLVIRTDGDDDYVRVLANRLLGQARSQHLRGLQARIKRRLSAEIARYGTAHVAGRLKALGSPIASENNLRRWAAPDSIRTHDFADFAAICALLGESAAQSLWDDMGTLQAAHMKAGNEVRRLLVAEIRKADGADLLQRGWGDYDVAEIEGEGSLRVARVTGRAPEEEQVPPSRLRRAFSVPGDLWLG